MRLYTLFVLLLLFKLPLNAQLVKPYILNSGGGTTSNTEWSIGESMAISTFNNNNINLSLGLLQSMNNLVTSLNDFGPIVFGDQISISPNPSFSKVKMIFKMKKPGKALVKIYNSTSKLFKTIELNEISVLDNKTIELEDLPVGVYFFQINFQPLSGILQSGIYKIIRL